MGFASRLAPTSHLCIFNRNAGINELQNLKYLPRSTVEREIVFEDRTPAHADHVGFGIDRITTAAVGKNIFYSDQQQLC